MYVLPDESGRSTIYERHYVRCGLKFAEFMLDIKHLRSTTISHLHSGYNAIWMHFIDYDPEGRIKRGTRDGAGSLGGWDAGYQGWNDLKPSPLLPQLLRESCGDCGKYDARLMNYEFGIPRRDKAILRLALFSRRLNSREIREKETGIQCAKRENIV